MISRLRWDERRHTWRRVFPWWWWTTWALVATMSAAAALGQRRAVGTWTPLQRAYAWPYAWSAAAVAFDRYSGTYSLLHVRGRTGSRLALNTDIRTEDAVAETGALRLSEVAVQAGGRQLEWSAQPYPHALVHGFLRAGIYGDRGFSHLLTPAFDAARTALSVGLVLTILWRLWWLLAASDRRGAPRVPSSPPAARSACPPPTAPPAAGPRRTPAAVVSPVSVAAEVPSPSPSATSGPATSPQSPAPFFE